MSLNDTISKVPTWGWAAGGILFIGLVFLMTRGGSSGTVAQPGVPSADVNDVLSQLQDAANQLGGSQSGTNPVPPTPTGASQANITNAQWAGVLARTDTLKTRLDALSKQVATRTIKPAPTLRIISPTGTIKPAPTASSTAIVPVSSNTVTPTAGYKITVPSGTAIPTYSRTGTMLGKISGLTLLTEPRVKINGIWNYKISTGKYAGRYVRVQSGVTYKAIA